MTFEAHKKSTNCFYCHKAIKESQKAVADNGNPVHTKCKVKYDSAFS